MIKTPYLEVSENGIDIIKDFEKTTHLEYSEIIQVDIRKGFLMNHFISVSAFGLLLTFASIIGVIDSIRRFDFGFISSSGVRLYLLLQFVPWILCILGLSLVYSALRISTILKIYTESGNYRVPIKEIEKEKRIRKLIDFLKERVLLTVDNKKIA